MKRPAKTNITCDLTFVNLAQYVHNDVHSEIEYAQFVAFQKQKFESSKICISLLLLILGNARQSRDTGKIEELETEQ